MLQSCSFEELDAEKAEGSSRAGLRLSMVPAAASMQQLLSALRPGGVPAVQRLQLDDCEIGPAALAHCTQLSSVTWMCLGSCEAAAAGGWEAAMAALLRHAPRLSSLHLETSLDGELPQCLILHSGLRRLGLWGNGLQALPAGPYLASLERLALWEDTLLQLPASLAVATALTALEVQRHPDAPALSAVSLDAVLGSLPRLQSLVLTRCGLQQLPLNGWAGISALTSLDLSWNRLGPLPAALSGASSLRRLSLSFNPQLAPTAQQLWELSSRLPLLEELDVSGCGLTELPARLPTGEWQFEG